MTALAGYWHFGGAAAEPNCRRMLEAQQVYARALPAVADFGAVAIGRRLLPVLDEDRFDRRPVVGGGGSLALVADLRIDNRSDLADDLGIGRPQWEAMSDAELLMKAWERWDEGAVARILGDFAFALWDRRLGRMVLARDFLGQRPLHYHRGRDFFAFATMPKGLHALDAVARAPNERATAAFLALLPEEGTDSFFSEVERVEPGTVVTVEQARLTARRYWEPDLSPLRLGRRGEYIELVRTELDRAVKSRLRGSGPSIGSHLSAGLDSSAVAATAAKLMAGAGGRVVGFTAVPRPGFELWPDSAYIEDEGPLAAAVAARYQNLDQVKVSTEGTTPLGSLDQDHLLFERPVRNLCNNVWSRRINDLAKARGLRVMLSGTMGNLSFSHPGLELLPQLLSRGRFLRLARETVLYSRFSGRGWKSSFAPALVPFLPASVRRRIAKRESDWVSDLCTVTGLSPQFVRDGPLADRFAAHAADLAGYDWRDASAVRLAVLRGVDPGNYNKGIIGGWGVDSRDPTADRRLVEICLRIPSEQYFFGGVPRALARDVLADRLPEQLVRQRRKGSQAVDWHEGLSSSRRALGQTFERLATCPPAAQIIDLDRMKRLVSTWPGEGDWNREEVLVGYRYAMLRALSAGHFLQKAGAGS